MDVRICDNRSRRDILRTLDVFGGGYGHEIKGSVHSYRWKASDTPDHGHRKWCSHLTLGHGIWAQESKKTAVAGNSRIWKKEGSLEAPQDIKVKASSCNAEKGLRTATY
jgi:hypothetical protein